MNQEERTRVLVLTPRIDGADGISEVARQVVRACAGALGSGAVGVWTLAGDVPPGYAGAVRRAEGSRPRLAGWALGAARRRADDLLVVVLHVHLLPLAIPLAVRGARLASFVHGIEAWRRLRPRERAALGRTDLIVANSHWTANRFLEANPEASCRSIAVCPPGVGEPPVPELPDTGGYALIVARMARDECYKGHELLIDVWPDVLRAVPSARLVVIGDGDDRRRLEELARKRGVASHVTFAGRVSDEQREGYYRKAAFFVMPSTREGFGLAYVEAMRAGRACIAAPGAASEIIEDGVTGFVVDPGSSAAVTAAIVRLFTDRELAERMGKAAAARTVASFNADRFADRFVSVLGLTAAGAGA